MALFILGALVAVCFIADLMTGLPDDLDELL